MPLKKPHLETLAIQSTENLMEDARPATQPIYMSSTYVQNPDGSYNHDLMYGRADNPNRATLEHSLALLEGGETAFAFGSGMAAISAVFQALKPGDRVLLPDDVYFAAKKLMEAIYERWGLAVQYVDMSDETAVSRTLTEQTALVWLETPSNPLLKITDLEKISALAKSKGALVAVDNTWPTPVLQRPLEWGADIVVHSTTKYLGGHSDVIGGAVIMKQKNAMAERIQSIQQLAGGVPSPFDCWLVARGIRTLPLRVKAQSATAMELAKYLSQHPKVEAVLYPGLSSHKGHVAATKQMKGGFGGMMSVLLKANGDQTFATAHRLQYFAYATSLGGVESLVEHRRTTEGPSSNAPENLLRISVGLEHAEDLMADWEQALNH